MDWPLRTRLLIALVGIVTLWGLLIILTGRFLINRMVIGEAQRRVALALKTADAMLERRLEVASELGKGSVFTVWLPFRRSRHPSSQV